MTTVLLVAALGSAASANPVDGVVAAGSATIGSSGNTLTIDQHTDRAVIDWRGFDIGAGETTRFNQPGADSVVLNRVNSATASRIDGNLTANGKVVIVNGNGVIFGSGAQVDVNSLVATTADIDNDAFMQGSGAFDKASANPNASIENHGTITAKEAGLVGLVAPNVVNTGVITAKLGRVHLASGDTVTVDLYGDGLMEVAVSDQVTQQLVANRGIIAADGGKVVLTAAAGRKIVNSLTENSGMLRAQTFATHNGVITISNASAGGRVTHRGQIDVASSTGKGGKATLSADQVTLASCSVIDASGKNGGGVILVGGDTQGANASANAIGRNAKTTIVENGAVLKANATTDGDGGKVIIWADVTAVYRGRIEATGGGIRGNGGFAEVSGKQNLTFGQDGTVNLLAPNGLGGTLLIDPANITINGNAGSGDGTNSFTIAQVQALGGGVGNISLLADNNIIFDLMTENLSLGAGRGIAFTATNGNIMSNSTGTITTVDGAVTFSAGGMIDIGTNLLTINAGGDVTATAVGDITLGPITAMGRTVSATVSGADNQITTIGAIAAGVGGNISLVSDRLTVGAALSGTGTLTLQPYSTSRQIRVNYFGGDFNLDQGELNYLINGWGMIRIGNPASLADTRIGTSSFADPVQFYGKTAVLGPLTGTDNASFAFVGLSNTDVIDSITTAGGAVDFSAQSYVYFTNGTYTIATNGGAVTFSRILTNSGSDSGTVNSGGGAITVLDTIYMESSAAGQTLTFNAGTGTVSFGSTVNTAANISASGATLSFGGAWGGSNPLGNVTLVSANALTLPTITTMAGRTVSATVTGAGNAITTSGAIVTGAGGNIILSADDLVLGHNLSGTGTLTLQTNSTSRGICINWTVSACAGSQFHLSTQELAYFVDGWSGIVIGRADNTAGLRITSATFTDPVSFLNNSGIYVYGALAGTGNAAFTFGGNGSSWTDITSTITTAGQAVTFNNRLNGYTGSIATSGGAVTFNNTVAIGTSGTGLSVDSGGGTITFASLSHNGLAEGQLFSINAGSGAVVIGGTVNGGYDLSITAGTITTGGAWGGTNALGNITLASTGALSLPAITTVAGKALSATVSGAGNAITTTGAIATGAGGNITLVADDLVIGGALSGTGTLTLRPYTQSRNVCLNFTTGAYCASGNLNLSTPEIAYFADGWAGIVVGRSDGTGTLKSGATSWTDPVTFQNNARTEFSGMTAATGNASVTINTHASGWLNLLDGGFSTQGQQLAIVSTSLAMFGAISMTTANGDVSITGGGALAYHAASTAAGTLNIDAGTGTVTLPSLQNQNTSYAFNLAVAGGTITAVNPIGFGPNGYNQLGTVSLTAVNSLTLPVITASSILARTTGVGADITLGGNLTASVTSGDAIVLASADDFFNTGNYTLTANGTGRWLIYSERADENNYGSITTSTGGFNRYSCSYASAGNCAYSATIGATVAIPTVGNGFIYSHTPILTVTPNAIAAIAYGASTPGLSGYGYTLSGYYAGEGVDPVYGSLNGSTNYAPGADVGSYGISYSTGGLASTLGYGFTYANNAAGITVVPRVLTASITGAVSKVYDGLTDIALASGDFGFGGNAYGSDDVSVVATTGYYADQNVGVGKNINASGLTLTGTKAHNYSLSNSSTQTTGSITQRALTITASDAQRMSGMANPALTANFTGLAATDNPSVISGVTLSTVATTASAAGQYAIVASGGVNGNYAIHYVNGTLTVTMKLELPNTVQGVTQNLVSTWNLRDDVLFGDQGVNRSLTSADGAPSNRAAMASSTGMVLTADQSGSGTHYKIIRVDSRLAKQMDLDKAAIEF